MSSPISICYIELILEPVKKRICGSATFRFPPSEPLLLKENPVVSGILFCDVSIFFLFGTTYDVSIWFCGSWGHDVSGWYLAEICVWLMQCAKTLNQICRPQRLEARWQGAGASQARTQHGLLQPGATGRQGRMGTLRWVSPGWWREGGAATCSWSSLSSSTATSAGQHGGYAHEPAISSYHSDPIYGW